MKSLLNALSEELETNNWYGALFLALSIPDILGKIQYPKMSSQKRYALWFKENIQDKYTSMGKVFLSGNDCYALRCAAFHEGSENIENQKAKERIKKFAFYQPRVGILIHNNMSRENVLQLQVDLFCKDMLMAAEKFMQDKELKDELVIREFRIGEAIGQ